MQQRKSLKRQIALIAGALIIAALTMGRQIVGATDNPGSILFTNSLALNAPDKTKQPPGNKKITICHVPPGNTGNPQTITISINAWKTDGKGEGGHGPGRHGGDYVGPCLTGAVPTVTPLGTTTITSPGATAVAVRPAWVAPVVTGPTCPAWLFYHSDRTGI